MHAQLVPSYVNPDLSDAEREWLELENWVALMTVQSMLGLIGPSVLGVAVEIEAPRTVTVHLAATDDLPTVADDADQIVFDLEVFLTSEFDVRAPAIYEGRPDGSWPGGRHRLLYRAK